VPGVAVALRLPSVRESSGADGAGSHVFVPGEELDRKGARGTPSGSPRARKDTGSAVRINRSWIPPLPATRAERIVESWPRRDTAQHTRKHQPKADESL
jgi:hypothetical protein